MKASTLPWISTLLAITIVTVVLTTTLSAGDAQAIYNDFERQRAEALSRYLDANPDAEDAAEAEDMLIASYLHLKDAERAVPLLKKRYEAMSKGDDADLEQLIGGIVKPTFRSYTAAGRKDEARTFLERVKADFHAHPRAAQIDQFLEDLLAQLEMPSVGDTMEFQFTAVDGRDVDLSKMTGKVVLVDYWATWCAPCIAEMPNMLEAYQNYQSKGFEIIGINIDQDLATFNRFASEHDLPWLQYCDGKGWESELISKYKISILPANFLIGKDGKIIATDVRGEELNEYLSKLLNSDTGE